MKTAKKLQEITLEQFRGQQELAGYQIGYRYFPPIARDESTATYQIRVLRRRTIGPSRTSESYGYFHLDDTGLITRSPHGDAAIYNFRVRIVDIKARYEEQATEANAA